MMTTNNQNPTPLVCIRCTVYNHEPFLRNCLEGFVIQQTTFSFEAIVHDDASTDGSAAIIREYAEKYPHIIKPIYEIENQWSKHDGSIRRIMDTACTSKYIAMCEGDDYWTDPHKLQMQVDYMENHQDCALCYTDCDIYYHEDDRFEHSIYESHIQENFNPSNPLLPRRGWYTANMTWLYRRDIAMKITPTSLYIDGALYRLCHFAAYGKIGYIPTSTGVYRRHVGSASCFDSEKKTLAYSVNTFGMKEQLLSLFPDTRKNVCSLYDNQLHSLYAKALEYGNKKLIGKYEDFYPRWFLAIANREIASRRKGEHSAFSLMYRVAYRLLKISRCFVR